PFKGFGSITGGFISSIGNSNYHSLTLRVERRFETGLSFISSFPWSKSIYDNTRISNRSDSSRDAHDARHPPRERDFSDYGVRHRWVLSYVYDLPFGRKDRLTPSSRVAKAIVGGWQTTGILTLQTGRPFTVLTGVDQSNTGANNDRPNIIGDWRVPNPGPDRWFNACTLSLDGIPRSHCLPGDKPAWQMNAPGTFGNAGRNIIQGDGLKNFDLGLYRFFKITERQTIQFRAEVFNLPNHPNF